MTPARADVIFGCMTTTVEKLEAAADTVQSAARENQSLTNRSGADLIALTRETASLQAAAAKPKWFGLRVAKVRTPGGCQ